MNDQLKLLVDYYTYGFIPLSHDEHVLYNLNPSPTQEERIMYYSDYARRDHLLSQSFAGELIKQFIDINGSLVQTIILPTLNALSDGYKFVAYCVSSKDATAAEILEKIEFNQDSSLFAGTALGAEKAWREFVLRTAGQEIISDKDKTLKENLAKFRSFKVKEQYLHQLNSI